MKTLVVIIMFSLPAFGQAREGENLYKASRVSLYSSLAFDLITTERAIERGGREGNPLLGQNIYRRVGIAVGATIGADFLTNKLKRDGHKRAATLVNFALTGVHVTAGGFNLRFQPRAYPPPRFISPFGYPVGSLSWRLFP